MYAYVDRYLFFFVCMTPTARSRYPYYVGAGENAFAGNDLVSVDSTPLFFRVLYINVATYLPIHTVKSVG